MPSRLNFDDHLQVVPSSWPESEASPSRAGQAVEVLMQDVARYDRDKGSYLLYVLMSAGEGGVGQDTLANARFTLDPVFEED